MNDLNGNILLFSNKKDGKGNLHQVKEGHPNSQDILVESQQNNIVQKYTNVFRLHCKPRNHVSCEDRRVRLVEYDSRMRQEAQRYSRLLSELNGTYCFTHLVTEHGGFDWTKKAEHDSQENYADYQINDEGLSSDLEATRLTEDEILYGGDLTLDQVISR